ncbi:hypothetical protein QFC24_003390 [Naganishia onofrii]|uniref:Uncharacterized protein n=1 Tax=Naganishia onofrii TaxID=1851511 RepID=A0ACC2XKV3_9TREE|nr:hypothetical protein QFC24_003390 [Naganishia onofrii]
MNDVQLALQPLLKHEKIELRFFVSEVGVDSSASIMGSRIMQEYRNHYEYIQRIVGDTTTKLMHQACSEVGRKPTEGLLDLMCTLQGRKEGGLDHVFSGIIPHDILKTHLSPVLATGQALLKAINTHIVSDLEAQAESEGATKPVYDHQTGLRMQLQRLDKAQGGEEAQQWKGGIQLDIFWTIDLWMSEEAKDRRIRPTGRELWSAHMEEVERQRNEMPATTAFTARSDNVSGRSMIMTDEVGGGFSCKFCESLQPLPWQEEGSAGPRRNSTESVPDAGFTNASLALEPSLPSAT